MITSIKNEKVKDWKKLHKRKERMNTSTFMIEGFHLLEEASKSDAEILEIIVQEDIALPEWTGNYPIEIVSGNVLTHISQTKAPQGVLAVIKMMKPKDQNGNHILIIDAIQDPGNLGTMIRTADAAGMDGIILGEGTVDLYNDKVIRATQGSIFHIPIYHATLEKELHSLKEKGFSVWATALLNASNYNETVPDEKVAIIMGNEGAGVDPELLELADQIVTIPIYGKAESLNVSIAAGILMYYLKS